MVITATGGSGYQYQWFKGAIGSGTAISGATTSEYNTATAGQYYCRVTVTGGCVTNSPYATVTVNPRPTATIYPTAVSLCPGWNTTLQVTASGGSGLQYQWFKGNIGTGTAISGATASSYSTATAGQYYCRVQNSAGCGVYSPLATVTTLAGPVITQQPQSISIQTGTWSGFSVGMSGDVLNDYTYLWYKGSQPASTAVPSYIQGAGTGYMIYILGASQTAGAWHCDVTLKSTGCKVSTNTVYVTVTP
jgi:hypothetical protein